MSYLYKYDEFDRSGWVTNFLAEVPANNANFEHLIIGYFDSSHSLIQTGIICSALTTTVIIPLRKIAREALLIEAQSIILAHNHPSGEACPSRADIETTRAIARLFAPLDIRITDHLIVAGDQIFSFRENGLL